MLRELVQKASINLLANCLNDGGPLKTARHDAEQITKKQRWDPLIVA